MKTRAAVAWEAGKPLCIEEVDLQGPKQGEVMVQLVATGVCHTDAYTLSGADPEGIFPSILGHEGSCVEDRLELAVIEWTRWCRESTEVDSDTKWALGQRGTTDTRSS